MQGGAAALYGARAGSKSALQGGAGWRGRRSSRLRTDVAQWSTSSVCTCVEGLAQ